MEERHCPFHIEKTYHKAPTVVFWRQQKQRILFAFFIISSIAFLFFISNSYINKTNFYYFLFFYGFFCLTTFLILLYFYCETVRSGFYRINSLKEKIPTFRTIKVIFENVLRQRNIELQRMKTGGDIYLAFLGFRPIVYTTRSSYAEQILKNPDIFRKIDPLELNMNFLFERIGNNIVFANGEKWKQMRELVHPGIHSEEEYMSVFHKNASSLCLNLKQELCSVIVKKEGSNVMLTPWLKSLLFDTTGLTLFGFNFNTLNNPENQTIKAVDYITNSALDNFRIIFPFYNKLPLPSNYRLKQSIKILDDIILKMIVQSNNINYSIPRHENVLDALIKAKSSNLINDNDLRNNISALIFASNDTTFMSLAATLYYLAKYQNFQDELRKESFKLFPSLDEIGNQVVEKGNSAFHSLQAFHSLGNFILESLRLFTPAFNLPRVTTQNVELGEYWIPKDTLIMVNMIGTHFCEKEWEDPFVFNPKRFNKGTYQNKFAYLPFGAGTRICPGRSFSLLLQKVILCHILRNFDIELPNADYKITLAKRGSVRFPDDAFHLRLKLRI